MTASQQSAASVPPPPLANRRPGNLTGAVVAELVERIVRGVHQPGTSLPPEPALCGAFSVSRTVVREAVKVLQEKGLVQVRHGTGTIVCPPTMWDMLDELVLAVSVGQDESLAILDDLVVTRRVLESEMAYLAARSATPEVIEELRTLVDRMDALVDDPDAYAESDRTFHDVMMQASGNRIARAVVRALESQVSNTVRYLGRRERALCIASNQGHRRIVECVAARDPNGASEAVFTHITDAWLVRRAAPGDPVRLQR